MFAATKSRGCRWTNPPSWKSQCRRRTSPAAARSSRTLSTRSGWIRRGATASTSAPPRAASPTSCCSEGPTRVASVDVGYGQLHERLRADPRVSVLERTNARELRELPFAPDLVVCDVSFISVRLALPAALALAAPGWEALVLVKPQFEAGRAEVGKGGVVRDPEVRARVVREVADAALRWGAETLGAVDSGLPGPKGNREVFLHLHHREHPQLPDDIDAKIAAAIV